MAFWRKNCPLWALRKTGVSHGNRDPRVQGLTNGGCRFGHRNEEQKKIKNDLSSF